MKRNTFLLLMVTLLFAACTKKDVFVPFVADEILVKNFNFDNEPSVDTYKFYASMDQSTNTYVIQNIDSLPVGTDVTKLKAQFTPLNGVTVKVNGTLQASGVTENDFSTPVTYVVTSESGETQVIQVVVNVAKAKQEVSNYILVNGYLNEADFQAIATEFGTQTKKTTAVGVGVIVSYLNNTPENCLAQLNNYLNLSVKYNLPVRIKLDGEQWWDYRSDLWNWWDPGAPGYNPANKDNVEWADWTADAAVKIGWRNWGSQIRVKPMPNLMSTAYREACRTELIKLTDAIKTWQDALPEDKKFLFVGIVVGWESGIGVNNYYYPNGNDYLGQPESNDPKTGVTGGPPSRGLQTIGYAAAKTAGIASSGTLTEDMQVEVVRRHLEDLSKVVSERGITRDKIFTHCGGWFKGEKLFNAAINEYSCPGWSFYDSAVNPTLDEGVMNALKNSTAPYWSATEWSFAGDHTKDQWASALNLTLGPKTKYVCIYNWTDIAANRNALDAISELNK
ncbi:MAG: hypothetical protein EOP46_11145 [Sphingobacteriaceae bacterium]|nr:MAG: hypothetical protein EOP46_11145 [Sphingobacteriaceae bacterium]